MTNDEFMDLWKNRNIERTVIITDRSSDSLVIAVCFAPDRLAMGRVVLLSDDAIDLAFNPF